MTFQKAEKQQARLRLALLGPAGSGKTYTALELAKHLSGKTALVDTEHSSASKYADLYEFDTSALTDHSPEAYIALIHEAQKAEYDNLIVDSLSHEWKWCLEEVDRIVARSRSNNSFAAWREVTPRHDALTQAMLASSCHVIATARTKMEYVLEEDERGRKVPKKVGMAPVQRDGLEYEFDLVADLDIGNKLIVSKTRCPALSGYVKVKPGKELADTLKEWLGSGSPSPTGGAAASNRGDVEKSPQDSTDGAATPTTVQSAKAQLLMTELAEALGGRATEEQATAINAHANDERWLQAALDKVKSNKRDSAAAEAEGDATVSPGAGEDDAHSSEPAAESQFVIPTQPRGKKAA